MLITGLLAAAGLSLSADGALRCRNQLEIWCSEKGCNLSPQGESTPLDIYARRKGELSVCAYTGCWEGRARFRRIGDRLIWTGDDFPFSTSKAPDARTDVTLIIFEEDGVGFIRAGGLATPLLCDKADPGK